MTFLIASLSPFYVTLFWTAIFFFNFRKYNPARLMLGIFMLSSSILFFIHAIFYLGYFNYYLTLDSLYMFTSLSTYPLYYLYVRLLTKDTRFKFKNLLYLLPGALLALIMLFLHLNSTYSERMAFLDSVLIRNNFHAIYIPGNIGYMAVIYFLSRLVFSIQIFYYLISGYFLATRYNDRIAELYSNLTSRHLDWVKRLSALILLTSITSVIVNTIGRGYFIGEAKFLLIPSLIFTFLLFFMGYHGNIQEYTIIDVVEDESESNEQKIVYVDTRDILKEKIIHVFETEELFKKPDLSVTLLCKKLHTNRTYISSIINEEFGESFNSYVNRHRIAFARKLMKKSGCENYSLDYFASESGFGSTSSFIRAFKQAEGITPGRFIRMHQ